jgi:predicted nucleic acid-binding protein
VRLFLDMCSIQRPLDDKTQPRVAIEAEAVLTILGLCEKGSAQLVVSQSLRFETERNPHPLRREYALGVLSRATVLAPTGDSVDDRARQFNAAGIKPLDAAHLAAAVEAQVDYFCTCDDRFLRRAQAVDTLGTKVVTPLELVSEMTK